MNVSKLRTVKGIKQSALAQMLGITQQALSRIEQKEIINDEILNRISIAIKVPKEAFFEEILVYKLPVAAGMQVNPVDKIIELYDQILRYEQQIRQLQLENELLRKQLQ